MSRRFVEDLHLADGNQLLKWSREGEPYLTTIVAAQANQAPALMTTGAFWKAVAQMGGYLARQSDGPPGWKTLWKGWLRVQTLLEGVHLASHLRL